MPSKHKRSWRERAKSRATPAERLELMAKEAAKRRRARYRNRFAVIYGRRPVTEADERIVRKMLRGHPLTCACWDCLWSDEEVGPSLPRVARVAYRPT